MEPNSPKKIQFAMPLFQSQLDPEAAEQIRRRRPTPASLVILNDQSSPEVDDKKTANSQGDSLDSSPKQRKQSVYTPPTMKELQLLVEQHLQKQDQVEPDFSESDTSCLDELSPLTNECCHGNGAPAFLPDPDWGTQNGCEHSGSENGVKLLLKTEDHPDNCCTGGSEQADSFKYNENPQFSSLTQQQIVTETDEQSKKPRRKDTPYHHTPPFVPGVKILKSQNESAFPEEEEGAEERNEGWTH
ncbi:protein phosphatase 1 regulatory subunit 1C isoform X1 [Protopterus annectens]|uniref:protein phosphatase 1 regulatory subunit 1C isoform X1 n=1 Tax=Protopterus annectens TaxID=7888 RepID=UPI001CF9FCA5|nr:protein phosphatase 1 regulatory subunit 1C isoform X1 [Protopterus annectens]